MAAPLPLGLDTARRPVVPRLRVHHGLGVERLHGVVGRILLRHALHCARVCGIERGPFRLGIGRVARRERIDERAVARGRLRRQFDRLGEGRQRRRVGLRHHRYVDVGAQDQRLAPEAERAAGVRLLRLAKRALRLGVIEPEREPQPLVEPRLRLRTARACLERQRAQVRVEDRRRVERRLRRHGLERRGLGGGQHECAHHQRRAGRRRCAIRAAVEQGVERAVAAGDRRGNEREGAGTGGGERAMDVLRDHLASFAAGLPRRRRATALRNAAMARRGTRRFLRSSIFGASPRGVKGASAGGRRSSAAVLAAARRSYNRAVVAGRDSAGGRMR